MQREKYTFKKLSESDQEYITLIIDEKNIKLEKNNKAENRIKTSSTQKKEKKTKEKQNKA